MTSSNTDTGSAQDVREVIVVGSGPAGYTAALYLARADLHPLVFEGISFGGALMTTTEVENYPGFPEGIMGPDLMARMREQAERFGAELRPEDVEHMELDGPIKKVTVDGKVYAARAIVLATGSAARYLNLPDEQRLIGKGVSACATCDGFFFKNQHIAVVGGGDSAMEEATFLTRFADKVTLVHRRDNFRASPIMLDRAKADPKISWATNAQVTGVDGEGKVESLELTDTVTGERRKLDATGLFLAIGHDPRSELFRNQVATDAEGYVLTGKNIPGAPADIAGTATSSPGVFACGDLVDHTYRQAITAAGSGCAAALDSQHYLASHGADTTDPEPEHSTDGADNAPLQQHTANV
ncbi:thioredoxin-disulfide reductase [Nakamurella aerolata]|uniref:Thioredoxin reductase n=1 Tax=Nakamurella aerolata TaxID=1656892 RepID=A0A849A8K7_9ACTN|nr:thioredoxin-disulfide reductase [Nakamurella aerolata]